MGEFCFCACLVSNCADVICNQLLEEKLRDESGGNRSSHVTNQTILKVFAQMRLPRWNLLPRPALITVINVTASAVSQIPKAASLQRRN
jgi:hypothetical protein